MELIDLDLQIFFGFKYVFNPSITRNEDETYLLICRLQNHPSEGYIGICTLNADLLPLRKIAVIKQSKLMGDVSRVMIEDPRSFVNDDKVYLYHVESSPAFLYFCYTVFGTISLKGVFQDQVVIDYKKNLNAFNTVKRLGLSETETVLPFKDWIVDKNWQFFIRNKKYYCIYQTGEKHEIFLFEYPNGIVRNKYITYNKIKWNYGRISGGTAPLLHTDGNYYCFFHSWSEWKNPPEQRPWLQRKYHIGVYVFESTEPFRVKMISDKPIISGSDTDALAPSGHSVVFPGSAFFDEKKEQWNIAIGWNDYYCKLLKIDHKKIIEDIQPVQPLLFHEVLGKMLKQYVKKAKSMGRKISRAVYVIQKKEA